MKKGDKFILLLLGLVALLMVATIGYRMLLERYSPQELSFSTTDKANFSKEDNDSTEHTTSNATTTDDGTSTKVPDFTVYDLEGNAVSLYDCLDKPVVLNFWATWCGPCQMEMPFFDKMYQQYSNQVTFLMVNVTDGSRDTVESVTSFYKDSGYTFPIYFDTTLEAAMTYGAYSIPLTFFIDTEGQLLYNQMGALSEEALAQCIELLVQSTTETTVK